MQPVYQKLTVDKDGTGDCFNACIASILNIPLEETYDVLPHHEGVWYLNWQKWLRKRGYQLSLRSKLQPPEGYSIVSVETGRCFPDSHPEAGKPISHACVALNGEIVHDSYPTPCQEYVIHYYHELQTL